jgi:hypothetical protein
MEMIDLLEEDKANAWKYLSEKYLYPSLFE